MADASAGGDVPGWGPPTWGGRSFEDSLANYNPWRKIRRIPVIGDLDPESPMDRLDKGWSDSITGVEAMPPTDESAAHVSHLKSDYIHPDEHPETFPGDAYSNGPPSGGKGDPLQPIGDRNLVAYADKLRPPYAWRSSGDYPLIAPADRAISSRQKAFGWFGGSGASNPSHVAESDKLDPKVTRYVQQVYTREQRFLAGVHRDRRFKEADADNDGTISREEFDGLLKNRQNKSAEEIERLWGKFHMSDAPSMNRDEFARVAKTGFDLGAISRTDIAAVLTLPPGAPLDGFWGSGAKCPSGTYVKGVRLKVMSLAGKGQDDTGLTGVGLQCGGGAKGAQTQTVEGPEGAWTEWATCPEGQRVFSVRARSQPYTASRDNAGLAGLMFGCRAADFSEMSELRFGEKPWAKNPDVIVGVGPKAVGGGWTKELMCPPASAMCGSQAHVVRDQGQRDDMGLVDLRLYCCNIAVDCSAACSLAKGGPGSVGCQVCKKVAEGKA